MTTSRESFCAVLNLNPPYRSSRWLTYQARSSEQGTHSNGHRFAEWLMRNNRDEFEALYRAWLRSLNRSTARDSTRTKSAAR